MSLENEFDLEKLFVPQWAQPTPANLNKFANHSGEDRGVRGERRDFSGGAQRRPGGPRPGAGAGGFGGGAPRGNRPGGPRPAGGGRGPSAGGDRRGGPRREFRRDEKPAAPLPLPELTVSFNAEENGVESIARQIRMNGRAYPLFQIARMVLQKPERHSLTFGIKKNAEGTAIQPLFTCALDETLWLNENEAVSATLKKHFATFYQADRIPCDAPKGVYTFVAQCGFSGVILGPPNNHDYQNKLRKLHTERFARMPFEAYKASVKIVKDEAIVKKWIEDQSFKTEYVCLNVADAPRLASMEEVEKHFRETHVATIIKRVDTAKISGVAARNSRSTEIQRLVRSAWEAQFAFPLQIATDLSRAFSNHGLQFFKVNRTVTHVSVAKPQFLDIDSTPVSDSIKRLIEFINAHPKCSRRKILDALAPSPKVTASAPVEGQPAAAPVVAEPSAEQTAIITDLHWLIHQGHVLEFADGRMETAKKPMPKPVKPAKVAGTAAPAAAETAPATAAEETITAAEVLATASAEEMTGAPAAEAAPEEAAAPTA
ncbi:MAG: hypothetical protein RLZZ350_2355 [Verrucomicrobiota bacterium]|jgi:hypothetical protein